MLEINIFIGKNRVGIETKRNPYKRRKDMSKPNRCQGKSCLKLNNTAKTTMKVREKNN